MEETPRRNAAEPQEDGRFSYSELRRQCGPGFPAPGNPAAAHCHPSLLRTPKDFEPPVTHYPVGRSALQSPPAIFLNRLADVTIQNSFNGAAASPTTPQPCHACGGPVPVTVAPEVINVRDMNMETPMTPLPNTNSTKLCSDTPVSLGRSGYHKRGSCDESYDFVRPLALNFDTPSPHMTPPTTKEFMKHMDEEVGSSKKRKLGEKFYDDEATAGKKAKSTTPTLTAATLMRSQTGSGSASSSAGRRFTVLDFFKPVPRQG